MNISAISKADRTANPEDSTASVQTKFDDAKKAALEQKDGYIVIRNADWDLKPDKDGVRRGEDAEIRVVNVRQSKGTKRTNYEATIEAKYKSSATGKETRQKFQFTWDSSAERTWDSHDLKLDLPRYGYDGVPDYIGLGFMVGKKENKIDVLPAYFIPADRPIESPDGVNEYYVAGYKEQSEGSYSMLDTTSRKWLKLNLK